MNVQLHRMHTKRTRSKNYATKLCITLLKQHAVDKFCIISKYGTEIRWTRFFCDATVMLASYFLRHQNKCPKIHLEINIYTVNVMQTIKTICYFSMRLLSRFGFLYPPPFLISLSCGCGCLLFEFELLSGALFCSLYCLFAQSETGVSMCRNDVNDVC